MIRLWNRWWTELRKQLGREPSASEVSARFRDRERVFRAPPMTPELVRSIEKISPQFHLAPTQQSRDFWELTQNGSCWGEFDALEPLLRALGTPAKVLEVACGLGLSALFFRNKLPWRGTDLHLYGADGPRIHYPRTGERTDRSFCGDLGALRQVLEFNGIDGYRVFDARDLDCRLDEMPGPYDLVYSFYAAGFHWSLADFWKELDGLLHERSLGVFTIHRNFEEFDGLRALPHRMVPFERSLAKDRPLRLLVVARDERLLEPLIDSGD